MDTMIGQSAPVPQDGTPKLDEILDRIGPEFVFVDPRQAPLYHREALESGESRLALAILEDALRCAVRHAESSLPRQREEAREALAWIESTEDDYWLAFEPICQRFSIDPQWVRSQVARILEISAQPSPRAA